ncbi:MAG: polyamine ABC transporter permease, partial [Rhodobacteraceae bacterium]|nr:polyamine ABC transporter permease [Paracoccaceae bacterium]
MSNVAHQYRYTPPRPPMWFNLAWPTGFGALVGFFSAQGQFALMIPYAIAGGLITATLAYISITFLKTRKLAGPFGLLLFGLLGAMFFGLSYGVLIAVVGFILARMAIWLSTGDYRLN